MTQAGALAADVVIVGGGHAGAQAAIALRQNGFKGSVLIVGREAEPPYERPPLSKEYLAREKSFERILIRPLQFWADKDVTLALGREVITVDPAAKAVGLSDGGTIIYGALIWAAGGEARRLSCGGAQLAGVHAVRNRSDVDALMAELDAGAKRAVVVGGGFIGLEAAAVLAKRDVRVTVIETLPRVLARVAGEPVSRFFEHEHRAHGVDVRLGAAILGIEGDNGRATGVRLADGTVLPAEIVIVGIGIEPAVAPLHAAGAQGSNGVDVDAYCRTSLPHVYAIGDCAAHVNAFAGGARLRVESVQNANDMALVVAKGLCGEAAPYKATPWFWSNQYDLKLQTVGLSIGYDAVVLRGDPATRSFTALYLKGGRVIALDCVNRVKDYVQGRKLVEAQAMIAPDLLADATVPLKDLSAVP